MTIGVEIESIKFPTNEVVISKIISKTENGDWTAEVDGSLKDVNNGRFRNGIEVISPVLSGKRAKLTGRSIRSEIESVCNILNIFGNYINDTCGGHVHIGANYLKSAQAFNNLLELWGNTESIMYIIANKEHDITRKGATEYAAPISGYLENAIECGTINLKDTQNLEQLKKRLVKFQKATPNDRYKGINFKSLELHKTIEFRLPNGTMNPNTWIENINLFGGVVKASQDLAEIQKLEESERTLKQQAYLENFEKLKSEGIDENKKLNLLLNLVIPEEERDVYLKRYKVNNEILETKHPERKSAIIEKTAKKGINIKKIGKKAFADVDRINGQEYEAFKKILKKEVDSVLEQGENSVEKYR